MLRLRSLVQIPNQSHHSNNKPQNATGSLYPLRIKAWMGTLHPFPISRKTLSGVHAPTQISRRGMGTLLPFFFFSKRRQWGLCSHKAWMRTSRSSPNLALVGTLRPLQRKMMLWGRCAHIKHTKQRCDNKRRRKKIQASHTYKTSQVQHTLQIQYMPCQKNRKCKIKVKNAKYPHSLKKARNKSPDLSQIGLSLITIRQNSRTKAPNLLLRGLQLLTRFCPIRMTPPRPLPMLTLLVRSGWQMALTLLR